MNNTWDTTKPNPYSFKRFPDGSGRVWSWAYCLNLACDECYDVDGSQKEVWMGLLNYDAWEPNDNDASCIHFECGQSGKDKCLVEPYDVK